MKPLTLALAILVPCAFFGLEAQAAPIKINQAAFSGSETVINFNTVANEQPINVQYAGQGVTFSGPIFGLTSSGDTNLFPANGGGVIAANWRYSQNGPPPFGAITATFSSLQTRVGFLAEHWPQDPLSIDVYNGATLLGTLNYTSVSLTPTFVGLQDFSGFDKIVFNTQNNLNQFLAIDDFRFENEGLAAVPEPTSIALFGIMAVGGAAYGWRRRNQAAAV